MDLTTLSLTEAYEVLLPLVIYVIGILVMVIGFFLTLSKKQLKDLKNELPIYEGEKIVGYRRHKK